MSATYSDIGNLSTDATFLKRLTVAVAHFANYILGEPDTTGNHKARFKWASSAIVNPVGIAAAIAPAVCLDPAVQASLAAVTDADLQSACEAACNLLLFN